MPNWRNIAIMLIDPNRPIFSWQSREQAQRLESKADYPEQRIASFDSHAVPLSGVQLEGGEYGYTGS
jgi:hypothetical protein